MNEAILLGFDAEGGLALALARGLADAALLSLFGALLFRTALAVPLLRRMEPGGAARFLRGWNRLTWFSLFSAPLAACIWLVLETASMAETGSILSAAAAVPTVLAETSFGHVLALRLFALVLTALVLGRGERWLRAATGLAAVATILQAGHSHAASMSGGPSLLLLSQAVHLLAAGAWLGGLLPLLLLVRSAPPDVAALASRRFSPLGTACVLLLSITASFQSWVLIGGLPGLVGTGYGLAALLKLGLFAALLGLAWYNRFRLTPALATDSAALAKRRLGRSIAAETGIGLLVVLAAGLLTSLPPAMHVQPIWPFARRLSLAAIEEDAGLRLEVIQAALALSGAAALLAVAALVRLFRGPAIVLAAAIAWGAAPHFGPLLAEAYPTSFYLSPIGFAATGIAEGARLFPEHCASCHGAEGRGDGPSARDLPVPPADLTSAHLWMHGDGELFWWLSHGVDVPEGGQAMPGFAASLSETERWALIDYIRALNAGAAMRDTGTWPQPIQAPDIGIDCGSGTLGLHDLRGRFVHLVIGGPSAATEADVVTIVAGLQAGAGACTATDRSVVRAYAIVSGIPERELAGTHFLIDAEGWLRAVQRPGQPGSWNDPQILAAEIRVLRTNPIAAPGSGDHMNMRM